MRLDVSVYIFVACGGVHLFIVRDVIDLVFIYEFLCDDPRCIRHDFVHPSTMSDAFAALCMRHDRARLVLLHELVRAYAHQQVYGRERQFGLSELESVPGQNR